MADNIINLSHPYPDFQQGAVMSEAQFDGNNQATRDKVNEVIARVNETPVGTEITTEITDSSTALDASRQALLDTHKASGDHDTRYFTETEVTTMINNLQNQVNTNDADIVALNELISALNTTYSTDVERIAAITQVINDYEAADSNLTTLISDKANQSDVYTKAQVDTMVLAGSVGIVDDLVLWSHLNSSLQDIINAKVGKIFGDGIISTSTWIASSSEYTYEKSVAITGILSTDHININLDKNSQDTASDAELSPSADSYDGGVKMYCNTIPTANMGFSWWGVR